VRTQRLLQWEAEQDEPSPVVSAAVAAHAKLVASVQRVVLEGVPTDQVASQDPAAGATVDSGGTVTLTVSSGPALVSVPDVGGKSLADATDAISSAGFNAKVTYSIQGGGDGTVVQQDPAPSAQARKGSSVNIMIAVPGTVPNVAGMTVDAAKSALMRLGYKPGNISYVQEGPEGTDARTEPAANTQLGVGETVSLYVNGASGPR
jgi:serine/threonine-protein kinase